MDIIVRLKTGFFEKTSYRLEAEGKKLLILPLDPDGKTGYEFDEKDILSILIIDRSPLGIEIQTYDALYVGVFERKYPIEDVVKYLKKHFKFKIICQYEGD